MLGSFSIFFHAQRPKQRPPQDSLTKPYFLEVRKVALALSNLEDFMNAAIDYCASRHPWNL